MDWLGSLLVFSFFDRVMLPFLQSCHAPCESSLIYTSVLGSQSREVIHPFEDFRLQVFFGSMTEAYDDKLLCVLSNSPLLQLVPSFKHPL